MSERPVRVQLSRKKGWRMPPNTVKVARPTKWGNPWKPKRYWDAGYVGPLPVALRHCVEAHRAWMLGERHWAHPIHLDKPLLDVTELRGKNLACWCPLDQPCHADVLLEIANEVTP